MERKICFILDAGTWGRWGGLLPKGRLPPHLDKWGRVFIDGGRRLHAETAQSALTVVLRLVTWWTDQCHLDCFRCSNSSIPASVCFHFFEGNSRSCDSCCHGYSLAITRLSLPPPGGAFIIYKRAHRTWLRILLRAPEEELKMLDFAYWLNYYYLVCFDCFPLFLHFLVSPIKLTLWLKCFHRQKAGWGHRVGRWGRTLRSCSISVPQGLHPNHPSASISSPQTSSCVIIPAFGHYWKL